MPRPAEKEKRKMKAKAHAAALKEDEARREAERLREEEEDVREAEAEARREAEARARSMTWVETVAADPPARGALVLVLSLAAAAGPIVVARSTVGLGFVPQEWLALGVVLLPTWIMLAQFNESRARLFADGVLSAWPASARLSRKATSAKPVPSERPFWRSVASNNLVFLLLALLTQVTLVGAVNALVPPTSTGEPRLVLALLQVAASCFAPLVGLKSYRLAI